MLPLERAHTSRRVGVWSVVGLLLLPLVIAGGFLLATWKSTDRLDRVQAAVVNLDKPVTLDKKLVPLGRQLAGGLVNGDDENDNFSWLLTDASDAASGLDSGRYAAVVTIPASFSALATSYSKNDDTAAQATLGVQTSQVSGLSDPVVGQAITAAATHALNNQLTEAYLDNIYVGFNDTGKQFANVADAAGKLSDGTKHLAKGLNQTSDGTTALADGLGQLDVGGANLAKGAKQLSTGTASLANGLDTFADRTAALPGGARKLATGTQQAADGADQLADGAAGLSAGVATYQKELRRQAAATAASVKLPTQPSGAGPSLPTTCPTTEPALTESQCQVFLQTLGTVVQQVGTAAQQAATQAATQAAAYGGAQGAAKALRGAAAGLSTKDPKTGQSLLSGAKGLASGQRQAADGLQQLANGTDSLADGLPAVSKGLRTTATGARKLSTGVTGLSDGITTYTDGVGQSAAGAKKLSAGVVKLADGGDQLADGTTKLADGLDKGAKAIPSYNKVTREKLSEVVTNPVTTPRATSVFSDVATTTLLAVLALWIGGLASFVVLRAISGRVLASMKSSWRLAFEALAPAAVIAVVQALVLTVLLQALLDLDAARLGQLLGFAVLTGLSFVAINHALVAWFGGVGRFVSVALVVLAAAGSITSAVPEVFDTILPALPLTPALAGFRAIVADSGGVAGPAGLLAAWLIAGVVAGALAVARHRVVAPLVAVPV